MTAPCSDVKYYLGAVHRGSSNDGGESATTETTTAIAAAATVATADGSATGGKAGTDHVRPLLPTLPTMFLPHGSPPIPIEPCASSTWLAGAAATLPCRPKQIVFMSPHFQSDVFTVGTHPAPPTMMDFDDDTSDAALSELVKLRYPCRGAPVLGRRVARLLRASGLPCDECDKRGLDHGAWTPLYVMFPHADVEVCCLSVRKDLDAAAHIAAGRALAQLRHEGVLLLGSGEAVHNVPEMGARDSARKDWCLTGVTYHSDMVIGVEIRLCCEYKM